MTSCRLCVSASAEIRGYGAMVVGAIEMPGRPGAESRQGIRNKDESGLGREQGSTLGCDAPRDSGL